MPERPQIVIDPSVIEAEPEPGGRGWFFETSWRVWSLGIMLDLSTDWRWIGVKIGPWCAGYEWRLTI